MRWCHGDRMRGWAVQARHRVPRWVGAARSVGAARPVAVARSVGVPRPVAVARSVGVVALLTAALAGCTTPAPSAPTRTPSARPAPATARPTPPFVDGPPTSIAALGDSLSRGTDACPQYGDCTAASWITGTDPAVDSLASRLRTATGARIRVDNDARSGVRSNDLGRQVTLAIAQRPSVVTVLIGANDACAITLDQMTDTATFAARIRTELHRLAAGVPRAVILVASIPDVSTLIPAASGDSRARAIWQQAGFCPVVLDDPRSRNASVTARRAVVTDRIRAYNAALRATCAGIARCVDDGNALFDYRPTIGQLSALDYFHPSIAGLRTIAATEWPILYRALTSS